MKTENKTEQVVMAVLRELKCRKGFSWWWDDILVEDRKDIIQCAESAVKRVLDATDTATNECQ